MEYEEIELKKLIGIIENNIALIVTATEIETEETHKKLIPLNGFLTILQTYDGSHTYFCGMFGKYVIVHVQSNMGSIARDGTIITVLNALQTFNPKIAIMIGIAFGVDEIKQKIGDVLISESIIPYNNKRVGETTIQRGQQSTSSKILLDRFKSVKTWQYIISDKLIAEKIIGPILSGEELIDNITRREELKKEFPTAKGGEMEGAGLFAACDGKAEWILIKGICDFADGKKRENKKHNQTIAINSALSLCLEIFNSNFAFSSINLNPYNKESLSIIKPILTEDILFELYREKNLKYYIERKEDAEFNSILKHYCIWIWGISGCGKTNLIFRNLINKKIGFTAISLVSCFSKRLSSIFKEIYFDLELQIGKINNPLPNDTFSNISKNILSILETHCSHKAHIILIEEIPLSAEKDYKLFISHLFALLILKNLKPDLSNVKFILSSIKNPTIHIESNQQKIHNQVKFKKLENWNDLDRNALIEMICKELNINITENQKIKLKSASENSPRFIKKFFRNLLVYEENIQERFEELLEETQRELKQYNND
jgi:nucleoside phosphorylase